MDLRRYLERIRYAGPAEPTAETLRGLHRAHMLAVPFENLDIHLRREITLDVARIYRKIVEEGRGGFCYEQNGLFAWALREVGFDLDLLSARVARAGGGHSPEFAHMALLVRVGGKRWLADVGFGDSFLEPLALDDAGPQPDRGTEYRVRRDDDDFVMLRVEDGKLTEKYRFTLVPRQLADYAAMCLFQQTSPESHFTQKRVCSQATPNGRVTLTSDSFIVTEDGRRTETPVGSVEEFERLLEREFGMRLPGLKARP